MKIISPGNKKSGAEAPLWVRERTGLGFGKRTDEALASFIILYQLKKPVNVDKFL